MITVEQLQSGMVLPIDKPRQWTSFQAVNKVKSTIRRLYGLKKFKIGHAGTLDPLATGLLLVCVGKATKQIPELQDGDKVYTGTMVLGATTPCYDMEQAVDFLYPYGHITAELLEQTRRQFEGTIMQVPPMFSAVKIDGQRAYEYARRDDPSVTIQPKPVHVYSFEITAFREGVTELLSNQVTELLSAPATQSPSHPATQQPSNPVTQSPSHPATQPESDQWPVTSDQWAVADRLRSTLATDHCPLSTAPSHLYKNPLGEVPPELPQVDFRICCGKGTYIRSLARDFGLALGSGAFLAALRREQIGKYTVGEALSLDQIEDFLTK